jgi:hypothetical protein
MVDAVNLVFDHMVKNASYDLPERKRLLNGILSALVTTMRADVRGELRDRYSRVLWGEEVEERKRAASMNLESEEPEVKRVREKGKFCLSHWHFHNCALNTSILSSLSKFMLAQY